MTGPHIEWLAEVGVQLESDFQRFDMAARKDPQQAGHSAEDVWIRCLKEWLPAGYDVLKRKYIAHEDGSESFETDVIVTRPSCPPAFKTQTQIPAGAVAAAFCVRRTLDRRAIKDAVDRCARLKRAQKLRGTTARHELLGLFPIGLLSQSHGSSWGPKPHEAVSSYLERASTQCSHPREVLDLVCVPSLGTWSASRIPYIPPRQAGFNPTVNEEQRRLGYAVTAMLAPMSPSPSPFATFIAHLYQSLSYDDPLIRPLADGFRLTDTLGGGFGVQRIWDLADVFSPECLSELPTRAYGKYSPDWGGFL